MMVTILALLASTPATVVGPLPALAASSALARRSQGGVEYLTATVSDTGAVVDCHAALADGAAFEDKSNCRALAKARFQPARDDDGRPVYTTARVAIRWESMMTVRSQFADAPGAIVTTPDTVYLAINRMPDAMSGTVGTGIRVMLDPAGRVEACAIATSSGNAALDRLACTSGPAMAHLAALHGPDGSPVRSLRLMQVDFAAK